MNSFEGAGGHKIKDRQQRTKRSADVTRNFGHSGLRVCELTVQRIHERIINTASGVSSDVDTMRIGT